MSDPFTTIITAAIEHAPSTGVVVAAYKAAKPFLERILGPGADELGEMVRDHVKGKRAQNAARTVADAATLLDATGREAQSVPLKVLDPLLNAASLEDEPALVAKWAALLANAADPAQRVAVQPGFVEVLRQLTPIDARVLTALCVQEDPSDPNTGEWKKVEQMLTRAALTFEQARLPVDNLARLHLCSLGLTYGGPAFHEGGDITPTFFARQFLAACTPPTT